VGELSETDCGFPCSAALPFHQTLTTKRPSIRFPNTLDIVRRHTERANRRLVLNRIEHTARARRNSPALLRPLREAPNHQIRAYQEHSPTIPHVKTVLGQFDTETEYFRPLNEIEGGCRIRP
jgi:hypothetical protein